MYAFFIYSFPAHFIFFNVVILELAGPVHLLYRLPYDFHAPSGLSNLKYFPHHVAIKNVSAVTAE